MIDAALSSIRSDTSNRKYIWNLTIFSNLRTKIRWTLQCAAVEWARVHMKVWRSRDYLALSGGTVDSSHCCPRFRSRRPSERLLSSCWCPLLQSWLSKRTKKHRLSELGESNTNVIIVDVPRIRIKTKLQLEGYRLAGACCPLVDVPYHAELPASAPSITHRIGFWSF